MNSPLTKRAIFLGERACAACGVSHKHYYQQAQQYRAVTLVDQKAALSQGAQTTTFPLSGANKIWNYFKAPISG
jgi:hypothetical protein